MDLGVGGQWAIVCGASKGLGYVTGQNFLIDGGAYPGTF